MQKRADAVDDMDDSPDMPPSDPLRSALRAGQDGTYRRRPGEVLARQFDRPFSMQLGGKCGVPRGRAGDWLVQYAAGEFGVVSAEVVRRDL